MLTTNPRFVLQAAGAAYAFLGREEDIPASIAIALFVCAICDRQTVDRSGPFVHWSAFAFSLSSLAWAARCSWITYEKATGNDLRGTISRVIGGMGRADVEGSVRLEDDHLEILETGSKTT